MGREPTFLLVSGNLAQFFFFFKKSKCESLRCLFLVSIASRVLKRGSGARAEVRDVSQGRALAWSILDSNSDITPPQNPKTTKKRTKLRKESCELCF